ncbi:MAG: putative ABC transport system permease protein [Bradymonadia bacterium]|jgi:putative ABC transport system permease protein
MRLPLRLAWQSVRHARWRTALLVFALGLTASLPLTVRWLVGSYGDGLTARAQATPLVLGAPGHRFDVVLAALWFRQVKIEALPFAEIERIHAEGQAVAIPLHVQFSARDYPIVGTTPEYHAHRQLRLAQGTQPLRIGEATVGAAVAKALSLTVGDPLLTDQKDVYNLAAAYPLRLRIKGVLAPSGGPDDTAVFVDLKTAWIIGGVGHGHRSASGRVESGEVQYQEITDANRASFHAHGDPGGHPVTAALIVPRDAKARTLLKARTNVRGQASMVAPIDVVDELLGVVVQVQRFLNANYALIGVSALIFVGLIFGLSVRMRAAELAEYSVLGAPRGFVARLLLAEWLLLLLGAALVAGGCTLIATRLLPNLASLAQ